MPKMERNFVTHENRSIELIGAPGKVQVYIDGRLYRTVAGLRNARNVAIDYSRRHAAPDLLSAAKLALAVFVEYFPHEHGIEQVGKAWGALETAIRSAELQPVGITK
jgi:hypothetical protein